MELSDLVGEHMLDGVDFDTTQVQSWGEQFEACEVMRFRLDGKVYTAVEDPSDGYRSSMRELSVSVAEMKDTFAPVRVIGRHRTAGSYSGSDDVLELIDAVNGKIVLEVGTSDADDYYPCFVSNFNPGFMHINEGK